MKTAIYNGFEIYQGSTFDETITITQKNTGNPVNLTGYDARMQLRDKRTGEVLIELLSTNSRISVTPLEGKIILSISFSDTTNLKKGSYDYDLEVFDGTRVDKYLRGTIQVIKEITR